MYVAEYADIQKAGLTLWMFLRRDKNKLKCAFACTSCVVVMSPPFSLCCLDVVGVINF